MKSHSWKTILLCILLFSFVGSVCAQSKFVAEWQTYLEHNRHLAKANPQDIIPHFCMAIALSNLGEIELALEKFEDVSQGHDKKIILSFLNKLTQQLEEDPDDHFLITQTAFTYFILHRFHEAIEAFDKSIKGDEKNIWLYNYKALCYYAMIDSEEAVNILKESLSIKNCKYTHVILGYIYWTEGSYGWAAYHFARTGTLFFSIRNVFN